MPPSTVQQLPTISCGCIVDEQDPAGRHVPHIVTEAEGPEIGSGFEPPPLVIYPDEL